jgi:shikimate kinase
MSNSKAVVLVGPMGVGKTTIGKKLAKRLEREFIDSDVLFTKANGDISEFFASRGEAVFRELESEIVISQLNRPIVLATGGGAVLNEHTRQALALATVVYLSTDGKHIGSRLRAGNRPLLKNGVSDWRAIYESRRALYEQVADITIDTSSSSLQTSIDAIVSELKKLD